MLCSYKYIPIEFHLYYDYLMYVTLTLLVRAHAGCGACGSGCPIIQWFNLSQSKDMLNVWAVRRQSCLCPHY